MQNIELHKLCRNKERITCYMNQILEMLTLSQLQPMRVDVYDMQASEVSSWFLSEYRIRSKDGKIRIFGRDKDLSYHWIEFINDDLLIADLKQGNIFNVRSLRFTYKNRYEITIQIQIIKKKAEVFGKTSTSNY